jgi:tRNA-intron endonuclease
MVEKKEAKVNATLSREKVISEDSSESRSLYDQSRFGEPQEGKFYYSLVEGLYLLEKKKMIVLDGKNKKIKVDDYIKKARKIEPNFWIRYVVFRDMRSRGYIVKTALKFGADFRVYDRGIKPGEDHAKWILYPVHEGSTLTWHEFSAKNRVAHSTRKKLLVGVVDEENDVTFYEIAWKRP